MNDSVPERRLTAGQGWAIAGCAAVLLWSIPGLFVNPDFAVGAQATSKLFLGVDMNGWHALSGFLIVIPVAVVFKNAELLPWVLAASAAALYGTALWTLLSERPAAGLFYFPHPSGDVILHIVTGTIFLTGAIFAMRERPAAAVA